MNTFWVLLGGDVWWQIYFGWWWVVVDIFWLVVGGGGCILAGGGWQWMVVGRGVWVVAQFSLTHTQFPNKCTVSTLKILLQLTCSSIMRR